MHRRKDRGKPEGIARLPRFRTGAGEGAGASPRPLDQSPSIAAQASLAASATGVPDRIFCTMFCWISDTSR